MRGFSLIEVMVALAILGIMLLVLFQIQASSVRIAAEARDITLAVGFAKMKLQDCAYEIKKNGFSTSDYNKSGNFNEFGYPLMVWECHAYAFKPPSINPTAVAEKLASSKKSNILGANMSASMLAPFFSMLSEAMASSVRELVVIVKVNPSTAAEEVQLTTHLTDTAAIALLSQGMSLAPGLMGPAAPANAAPAPAVQPAPLAPGL